jgi:hypothetical protein
MEKLKKQFYNKSIQYVIRTLSTTKKCTFSIILFYSTPVYFFSYIFFTLSFIFYSLSILISLSFLYLSYSIFFCLSFYFAIAFSFYIFYFPLINICSSNIRPGTQHRLTNTIRIIKIKGIAI